MIDETILFEMASLYRAGLTLRQLAKKYGATNQTIWRHLLKIGVPMRKAGRRYVPVTERRCSICRNVYPIDLFEKNSRLRHGHGYNCRECARKRAREAAIQMNFGITLDHYHALLREQGGGCAICGSSVGVGKLGRLTRLAVDHCHQSGVVRGILCYRCNAGLGHFLDRIPLLQKAIQYLSSAV